MIQAKLSSGKTDDKYEREADQIADKVMRMPEPASTEDEETVVQAKPIVNPITPLVQRVPVETMDEGDALVQTKSLQANQFFNDRTHVQPKAVCPAGLQVITRSYD